RLHSRAPHASQVTSERRACAIARLVDVRELASRGMFLLGGHPRDWPARCRSERAPYAHFLVAVLVLSEWMTLSGYSSFIVSPNFPFDMSEDLNPSQNSPATAKTATLARTAGQPRQPLHPSKKEK